MVEQRWTTRAEARLSVDLQYEGQEITGCWTRDISFGGAFIEVQQQLAVDMPVEVVFRLGDAGKHQTRYRVPAKVVRTDSAGVGIMFKDFDVSAFRSLREVLRYRDHDSVSSQTGLP